MQYRDYGNLGYKVSLLGMGCMRFPRVAPDSDVVDKDKTFELIDYAIDHGVNYFDTALTYHGGKSEAILGEALAGKRDKVKVVTKQLISYMKTTDDIRRNLENTLKDLRTDHLDVYLIHSIGNNTWGEIKEREIIKEFEKFRDEGLIKAIGFSYHGDYDGFKDIYEYYPWQMCQVQQNLMDVDREVTDKVFDLVDPKRTALVVMEPLRGGGLANAPGPVQKLYDTFDKDRPAHEWAFRHIIDKPQVSTILSGMTTLEQLKANIELFSKPDAVPGCLSQKEKDILREAKDTYQSMTAVPCTGCEYCIPCPNNVAIPGIFSRYNEGAMFDAYAPSSRFYMFYQRSGRDAAQCIECGVCEEKCPQNINIMEQLKNAHEKLAGWVE